MILLTYPQFRSRFAEYWSVTTSCDFTASTAKRNDAGEWSTDNIVAGMSGAFADTASNDAKQFYFETVTTDTITFAADQAATVEPDGACTLKAWYAALDGYPAFPGPFSPSGTNLVRANSFTGGFTGVPLAFAGSAAAAPAISVNDAALDATNGTDEYDWWLSQRTEDPARQQFALKPRSLSDGSRSGTVELHVSSLLTSHVFDAESRARVLVNLHLYVRRISDGAIQWIDLGEAMK